MARVKNNDLPTYGELIKPTLQALIDLGGSGSIEEINEKVYELTKLSNNQLRIMHGRDGRTEVEYRLAWARTYLKKSGFIENSSRAVWALTKSGINPNKVDIERVIKSYREAFKTTGKKNKGIEQLELIAEVESIENWKQELLNTLYNVTPDGFERLAQRILRESGFFQVEVTGKTGDGGIDGKGIVRISGFLSFHVIFQCKRYRGSVTPDKIRDFRGAMQGRADKGLFITTGTFTREAIKEATRDGAPPIDLIDGELLCGKLKELKLGVETKMTETVEVKKEWFSNL